MDYYCNLLNDLFIIILIALRLHVCFNISLVAVTIPVSRLLISGDFFKAICNVTSFQIFKEFVKPRTKVTSYPGRYIFKLSII